MKQSKVKVIVLRTAGTNCDQETVFAFHSLGAQVELVHINRLFRREVHLKDFHILAIPGGFSYGDDIAAGKILANELRMHLGKQIREFIDEGKLIIGICNGFQVLVKAGILPGPLAAGENAKQLTQNATLTFNDSGKFEDRWVYLRSSGKCIWTNGIKKLLYLPVAHGEGKFVPQNTALFDQIKKSGQIILRYCDSKGHRPDYPDNPNGSIDDIAGITDKTGRVLGLMPHPERHFLFHQHPAWSRMEKESRLGEGAAIFENGINYVKENLLKSPVLVTSSP